MAVGSFGIVDVIGVVNPVGCSVGPLVRRRHVVLVIKAVIGCRFTRALVRGREKGRRKNSIK